MKSPRPALDTRFVVMLSQQVRDDVGQAAARAEVSDGAWVRAAIREKLERDAQPS